MSESQTTARDLPWTARRVAEGAVVGLVMGLAVLLSFDVLWPGLKSLIHGDGFWVGWIGFSRFWEGGQLVPWALGFVTAPSVARP